MLADRVDSPAAAAPTWQLPERAQCLRCTYRLHGLTEPRCPECGEVFDPALWRDSITALWPKLLAMLLGGRVVLLALSLSVWSAERIMTYARLGIPLQWMDLQIPAFLLEIAVMGAAATALWKMRDLGRKLYVAGLLLVVARSAVYIGGFQLTPPRLLLSCLASLLMIAFLLTGLRRCTLARRHFLDPPPLPRSLYSPRQDWLLLITVVLSMVFLARLVPALAFSWKLTFAPPGAKGPGWPSDLVIVVCSVVGLVYIRRRPEALPRVLAVSLSLILLALLPFGIASMSAPSLGGFVYFLSGSGLAVLPWAVILLWYRMFRPQLEPAPAVQEPGLQKASDEMTATARGE